MKPLLLGAGLLVAGATACSPTVLTQIPVTKPSIAPIVLVGTALEVKGQVDPEAVKWASDAQLVEVEGVRINGFGVNDTPGSVWRYTYRSDKRHEEASFVVSQGRVQGPQAESWRGLTPLPQIVPVDSDDAVLRLKQALKDKSESFSLRLAAGSGDNFRWEVEILDELGRQVDRGTVNASTGQVTA